MDVAPSAAGGVRRPSWLIGATISIVAALPFMHSNVALM